MRRTAAPSRYRDEVDRKFYADRADRRILQILVDAAFIALAIVGALIGSHLAGGVRTARDGATSLQTGTSTLARNLTDAANNLSGVPFIGSSAAKPFNDAATSAGKLSASGENLADGLGRTADLLGPGFALLSALVLLLVWMLTRGRYVQHATRVTQLGAFSAGEKLLVLEAKLALAPEVWRDVPETQLPGLLREKLGLRDPIEKG